MALLPILCLCLACVQLIHGAMVGIRPMAYARVVSKKTNAEVVSKTNALSDFGQGVGRVMSEVRPAEGLGSRILDIPIGVGFISLESYFSTLMFMIPVGLILKFNKLMQGVGPKRWFTESSTIGLEWARISAIYSGGEKLSSVIRGKDDKWNSILGSGVASGVMRINEGPFAVLNGFVLGCVFVYAINAYMPSPTTTGKSVSTTSKASTLTLNTTINKAKRGPTSFNANSYMKTRPFRH